MSSMYASRNCASLVIALALSACGSRPQRVAQPQVQRVTPPDATRPLDPTLQPQPEPAQGTPEQDFVLSDEPLADPAALLRATRHNCCDEASAAEVHAGVADDRVPAAKPAR